ncbi:MAG: CAP domain-containing protein [Candidatus Zixiibacteriota bacterium]
MKFFSIFLAFMFPMMSMCSGGDSNEIMHKFDRDESEIAFKYLNHVRQFPNEYGEKIGTDLSGIEPRPALIWNDTLAKVAEQKALDMAKRDYLSQLNPEGKGINFLIDKAGYDLPKEWLKDEKANYFGSVQGGPKDGVDAIQNLIKGDSANRRQLLGTDDFSKDMKDIGIGFVRSYKSTYRTYVCIIIAKHNFK